jgi:hypothetical protein
MKWWQLLITGGIVTLIIAYVAISAALRLWWWMFTGVMAFAFDAAILGAIALAGVWAYRSLKKRIALGRKSP